MRCKTLEMIHDLLEGVAEEAAGGGGAADEGEGSTGEL